MTAEVLHIKHIGITAFSFLHDLFFAILNSQRVTQSLYFLFIPFLRTWLTGGHVYKEICQ